MTTTLNDLWSFYFHDPFNSDWNYASYIKINDIGTAEDFWSTHETFIEKINLGMFFLTREHIFPCWDDPYNKDGGCLSIKVMKQDVQPFWESICIGALGETLLRECNQSKWDRINGVSISPKKHFCIVKIWTRTNEFQDPQAFNLQPGYYGDVIYKANRDNIDGQTYATPPPPPS